jgi:hypothetical protein
MKFKKLIHLIGSRTRDLRVYNSALTTALPRELIYKKIISDFPLFSRNNVCVCVWISFFGTGASVVSVQLEGKFPL